MALAETYDHEPVLEIDAFEENAADQRDLVGQVGQVDQAELHLAIHDASRIEWSVVVPLPDVAPLSHELTAELVVPANAYVGHSPWQQLQMFARLDGDSARRNQSAEKEDDVQTIDGIRREALARAGKLSSASKSFARHCRLAVSLFAMAPRTDLGETLRIWLTTAEALVTRDRAVATLDTAGVRTESATADGPLAIPEKSLTFRSPANGHLLASEAEQVTRERDLADEYVSVRYVELLAAAARSLSSMLDSRSPHTAELTPVVEGVQDEVADLLERELDHRRGRCWPNAEASQGPEPLERYLDRASALKKHFQEVLFLETEHKQPAQSIQLWARMVATLLAGALAFCLQLAIVKHANVGEGLTALAVVAGLCYAARDRFKESGREWLAGTMARHYAHRVTTFRLPSRRSPRRELVASARESIHEKKTRALDPLNPAIGASVPVTTIQYVQRGITRPQPSLRAQGVQRVKHVFRYDLSPLFARLDDATKQVPVLARGSRRVSFTDAPRCYRVEIRLRLVVGGKTHEEKRTLVLSKRGLERLERSAA